MRRKRLALIAALSLALAPGTWLRSPPPERDVLSPVTIAKLAIPAADTGRLRIAGAWHLSSPNYRFGGYSSLISVSPEGVLLAGSDAGQLLRFPAPDGDAAFSSSYGLFREGTRTERRHADLEALAHDPVSGLIWGAYERTNAIFRYAGDLRELSASTPDAIAGWDYNAGAEAMERLADGRFILISEGRSGWFGDTFPAVMFAADPVDESEAFAFKFRAPEGYSPVGLSVLPNGLAVILLRRVEWTYPLGFASKIVLADPADIAPGAIWEGRTIATIANHALAENFEGVAAIEDSEGNTAIWIISDDNFRAAQRTLLLKLVWHDNTQNRSQAGHEKAR